MKKTDTEDNHALCNARAYIARWVDAYAKYQTLQHGCNADGGADEVKIDGDTFTNASEIADRLQAGAISVEVRGAWHTPGGSEANPAEFQVLISTGGPAFRIIGDLDLHGCPTDVRAEHQDRGTPWTTIDLNDEEQEAVDWFAGLFYYGE